MNGSSSSGHCSPPSLVLTERCPICVELPKSLLHGRDQALKCYQCKMFMKWAHADAKYSRFSCKFDRKCKPVPNRGMNCYKCRYELCVSNGLRLGLKRANPVTKDAEEVGESQEIKRQKREQRVESTNSANVSAGTKTSTGQTLKCGDEVASKADLLQITQILQFFSGVVIREESTLTDELIDKIVNFHLGKGQLSETDFFAFIAHLATTVTNFAKSQLTFQTLTYGDQIKQCSRGSSLYIQYVIARYFTSLTGFEQLQWMLGERLAAEHFRNQGKFRLVSLTEFLGIVPFMKHKHIIKVYELCLTDIAANHSYSVLHKGLLVNLLIYSQAELVSLDEASKVKRNFQQALLLLEKASRGTMSHKQDCSSDISQMLITLEAVDNIFGRYKFNSDNEPTFVEKTSEVALARIHKEDIVHIPLGVTFEDVNFLQAEYSRFRRCYSSVPSPPFIIDVFKDNTSNGTPVPQKLLPHSIRIFMERFRTLFHAFSNDHGISQEEQLALWSRNCAFAVGFNILKMETAKTGNEQLNYLLGRTEDVDFVKQQFNSEFNILRMNSVNVGRLSERQLADYSSLVSKIKDFVKDGISFMLITMITLLHTGDREHNWYLETKHVVRKQLMRLFQKHLRSLGIRSSFDENEFNMVLNHIKGITKMVPKLILPADGR